jgi:hypothetical protein
MNIRTELFLLPICSVGGEVRVLLKKEAASEKLVIPSYILKPNMYQNAAAEALLSDLLTGVPAQQLEYWLQSSQCHKRIVDSYDRELLLDTNPGVALLRAVAIPEDLAPKAKGLWYSAAEVFGSDSSVANDSKLFVKDALDLVPHWVRYSTFAFELLPKVFSIQDLRVLVGSLSKQEIDPGNFHRRLKRLDILTPLVAGQRVHKWEFTWDRREILRAEGLIP